jgi:hypothetical protein
VQDAARRAQQVFPGREVRRQPRAAQIARKGGGGERGRLVVEAESDGVQALIGGEAMEETQDARRGSRADQFLQWFLDRGGDEVGTNVQVTHEPARHQRVDERYRGVGENTEGHQQRNEESKR